MSDILTEPNQREHRATLYVYKGEWGLASIDFECMRALCLVKFTRFPVNIETNGNPFRSGSGKLPYLQIGKTKFIGYDRIKKALEDEGYPIDANLEDKFKLLSSAHVNWVFTNLHAYYHYFMYADPNNIDITRALYAKRTPFPFNFYYPAKYQKEAFDIVDILGGFDIHDKVEDHNSDYLNINAKKCVNILSRKLGKKVWFYGNVYSEFDVIVYSYLSILFKITLPNNQLQNHIKGCQNIVNFINRISRDIFKDESFNSIKAAKGNRLNDPMLTATERKFLESEKKTKILAGIGAVVAMGSFAAWRGLYSQFSSFKNSYDGFEHDTENDDDEME